MVCCYESQILEFSGRNLNGQCSESSNEEQRKHPPCLQDHGREVKERAIREAVFISGELRFNYGKNVMGRDSILTKFHLITKCM